MSGYDENPGVVVAQQINSEPGSAVSVALKGAYVAVCQVVGDGTTDDGAAINAALSAASTAGGGRVIVPRGSTGIVLSGQKIVLPSNTILELAPGVTLRRKTGLTGNFVANAAQVAGTGRDVDVGIVVGVGAALDCGDPGAGAGVALHSIVFRHCDGLTIEGHGAASTVKTGGGRFAVSIADVTGFSVRNFAFSAFSDGCHVMGPAARGFIGNLWGTTGDDSLAVTPNDWTPYNDTSGDVTDLVIENLYGTSTSGAVLKLLGGSAIPATALRRVSARNIFGTGNNNGVFIGDDTSQANTTGGVIDGVSVENVRTAVPNAQSVVWINGSAIGTLRINGLHYNNSSGTADIIRVSPASVATIGTLSINDVNVTAMGASAVIAVDANGRITRLLVDRLTIASAALGGTGLKISGGVTDLSLRGAIVSLVSAYLLSLASTATSFVTRASFAGVNLVGSGGGLITATVSGQTLPNVELAGVTVNGTAWLFDLNTTTVIDMASVAHVSAGSGIANIRAAGNLTFRGDGLSLSSGNLAVTAGGTAHVYSLTFPCDVSKLTKDNNAMANNTNGALACGAGPVVCNGTSFKHLYTGATY